MIISIHQPDYIPYLGYFYKIAKSDVFVFLDDVQFSNDNMHHWNRVKTPQGECRLKVPVAHSFGDKITEVRTRDELKWKEKHLKTLEMNYSKAQYFKEIFPQYKELITKNYKNLSEMNISLNKFFCEGFGYTPTFVRASELNINTAKEDRVIDICLSLDATTYLSGNGARVYQVEENFNRKGLSLQYSDFTPIEYTQLWGEFKPNLSVLDYVFNCGFNDPFRKNK
jgi:hypothetical protein